MRQLAKTLLPLLLVLLAPFAAAELADQYQAIEIWANKTEFNYRNGQRMLKGAVHLSQGTLLLEADNASQQMRDDDSMLFHADGHPVRFKQKIEGRNAWMRGEAQRIDFDSQTGLLKLNGHALIVDDKNEISANSVTYNTRTHDAQAEQGNAVTPDNPRGQVRIVIQPKLKAPVSPTTPATTESKQP